MTQVDDTEQTLLSEQDIADMSVAYTHLLNKFVAACNHQNGRVAVAALMSAAGTVVAHAFERADGEAYFKQCVASVLTQLPEAYDFNDKARTEMLKQ